MSVLKTHIDEGVAEMTVTLYDDDHKFDVWMDDGTALVEYQETRTWRGQIRVSDPDKEVYEELMLSDEMTEWLDENGADGVKRAEPSP